MRLTSVDYSPARLPLWSLLSDSLLLRQEQEQGEGGKMDIMWRPPLPELKAGKADTDCPNREDYCEVRRINTMTTRTLG